MKSIYVDWENVTEKSLEGIEDLEKEDKVFIFISDKNSRVEWDFFLKVKESSTDVTIVRVTNGTTNALDFQLSTFLGYQIAKMPQGTEHIIISRDKGFRTLKELENSLDACINIKEKLLAKIEVEVADANGDLKKVLDDSISNIGVKMGNKQYRKIINLMTHSKSLNAYHNSLREVLGNNVTNATKLYQMTKHLIKEEEQK